MSNWADLPHVILSEIMCRLSFYDDFVIFGAICKSWQEVYSLENSPLSPRCPWLILAEELEQKSRVFLYMFDYKAYNINLSELVGKKCIGTFFGWLLSVGIDFQINLIHPLSKHLLSLPPQPLTHEYDHDCIIMVIYGNTKILAFTRPGYKAWIDIKSNPRCFDDIAFYQGKFYAVDCHGEIFVCHTDDHIAFTESVAPCPLGTEDGIQKYIVESRFLCMVNNWSYHFYI
ncbi:hypothetical protein ACB092_11G065100 [Castanea dentata]